MKRIIVLINFVFFGIAASFPVAAIEMSDQEYAILPDYCRHKKWVSSRKPNPPASVKWESTFGDDFVHIHHYCWAMVRIARSYRASYSSMEKRSYINDAIRDINYVLDNSSDKFPIRAELNYRLIELFARAGNYVQAENAFKSAIESDSGYWRAYWGWGYWLSVAGRRKEALIVIGEGLRLAPETKPLIDLEKDVRKGGTIK